MTEQGRAETLADKILDLLSNDETIELSTEDDALIVKSLRLFAQTNGRVVCMNCGSSPEIGVYSCDCINGVPEREAKFAAMLGDGEQNQ